MMNIGFSQMVPVMPLFVAELGGHLGATGVGMVIAAPSAAMLFLNVPLGRVCDTLGRKPLMYCGTAMTAAGMLATAYATNVPVLTMCRLLVGAGVCASSTGSSAYMADLTDRAPTHRAKIMGVNQAIAGSVWVVGPAVGGWLAEAYGLRNSFVVASAGAAMCSLGFLALPETLRIGATAAASAVSSSTDTKLSWRACARGHVERWWVDITPIIRSSNQQALIALSAVPSLRWSCFSTVVTLYAASTIGAGPMEIGYMFTALALSQAIGMIPGSYLADKLLGAKLVLVIPAGLVSCVSFAATAGASCLEHFVASMAVQGFCAGFTVPAQGAFRAEVTPQAVRGQAMSLERQAGAAISLCGPVCMGLLSDVVGSQASILLTSVLMVGCHIIYLLRAQPVAAAATAAAGPLAKAATAAASAKSPTGAVTGAVGARQKAT